MEGGGGERTIEKGVIRVGEDSFFGGVGVGGAWGGGGGGGRQNSL